jgi:hypothetical protein
MKTFEQYFNLLIENFNNKEKEMEEFFLQLSHINELDIKFNFIEYKDTLFYLYKNKCLFDQDKKTMYFYINYDKIWSVFEKEFSLNYQEIKDFMSGMVEKHFKLKDYTPFRLVWH